MVISRVISPIIWVIFPVALLRQLPMNLQVQSSFNAGCMVGEHLKGEEISEEQ